MGAVHVLDIGRLVNPARDVQTCASVVRCNIHHAPMKAQSRCETYLTLLDVDAPHLVNAHEVFGASRVSEGAEGVSWRGKQRTRYATYTNSHLLQPNVFVILLV
jgi:hypothetical protein